MNGPRAALSAGAVAMLTLDTSPWLSCDDCFELVDGIVDRFVSGLPAIPHAFRAHLTGCPACFEEAGALLALVAEGDGLAPEHTLTAFGDAVRYGPQKS